MKHRRCRCSYWTMNGLYIQIRSKVTCSPSYTATHWSNTSCAWITAAQTSGRCPVRCGGGPLRRCLEHRNTPDWGGGRTGFCHWSPRQLANSGSLELTWQKTPREDKTGLESGEEEQVNRTGGTRGPDAVQVWRIHRKNNRRWGQTQVHKDQTEHGKFQTGLWQLVSRCKPL